MLLPLMRDRLLSALTGTPDVLDTLLGLPAPADPLWDLRLDPARFTLREIVAHLADYEAIWRERLARTHDEVYPVFTLVDPAALAAENDYAHIDPAESLVRFRERRGALVAFLRELGQDDWQRPGQMAGQPLTLEEQAAFVCVHDGYHTDQVAQWLAAGRESDQADNPISITAHSAPINRAQAATASADQVHHSIGQSPPSTCSPSTGP